MRANSRRGAALLLTLVLIGLLALAVVEFIREARYETVSAANTLASVEALGLTRSGAAAGAAILKHDLANSSTDDRSEFWYAGEGEEASYAVPVGEYTVSLHIEDLYGKFPIGSMVDGNGKEVPAHRDAYVRLIESLELEGVNADDLADALVDWMDEGSEGHYEVNDSFTVPDAVPEHLDELSRIAVYRDLPRETLARIRSYLDTRTEAMVNVNTASVPVLMAIMSKNQASLSREDAEAIHGELWATPVANDVTLRGLMPVSGRAFALVFKSPRFALNVKADVRGIVKEARCVVTRDFGQKTVAVSDWIQN